MPAPQYTNADGIFVHSPNPVGSPPSFAGIVTLHGPATGEAHTFELYARTDAPTSFIPLVLVEPCSPDRARWIEISATDTEVQFKVGSVEKIVPQPVGWHLYSVCVEPSEVRLYIDAELVATLGAPGGHGTGPIEWIVTVYAAQMAYTRLWAGARTSEEIDLTEVVCPEPFPQTLRMFVDFTRIPARDLVDATTDVSLTQGACYRVETQGCRFPDSGPPASVNCHASDDLLFAASASFTVESWFYCTAFPSAAGALACRGGTSTGYLLHVDGEGDLWGYRAGVGVSARGRLSLNTWTHCALTYDGATGQLVLYVDGVAQANTTTSVANTCPATAPMVIGNREPAAAFQFRGLISEVRVWETARTPQQIQQQMTGHPLLEDGLVAYYEFDENSQCDLTGGHPDIDLSGVHIDTITQDLDGEDIRDKPSPDHVAQGEPTPAQLQDALAALRAAIDPIDIRREGAAPDHSWLAQLDQRGALVVLGVDEGRLVLKDGRAAGQPIILRASDATDEYLIWLATILITTLDLFISVAGLRLVGGSKAVNYTLKMMRDGRVTTSIEVLMAAVTVHGVISFAWNMYQQGYLLGFLWALVDLSWWGLLRFLGGLARYLWPAGYLLVVADLLLTLIQLINLVMAGPPNEPPDEILRIRVFQAKWGDAILLSSASVRRGQQPNFQSMLVDGGPGTTYPAMASRLPMRLNTVCVTHVDSDHIEGVLELLRAMPASGRQVDQILFNVPPPSAKELDDGIWDEIFDANGRLRDPLGLPTEFDDDPRFELGSWKQGTELGQVAGERHIVVVPVQTPAPPLGLGGVVVEITGPQPYNVTRYNQRIGPRSERANRESIIFKVKSGRGANAPLLLMTGDAWDRLDADKPPAPNGYYRTDIRGNPPATFRFPFLKVPHHGSANQQPPVPPAKAKSEDQNFYQRYTAENYLISGSEERHHELPTRFALQAIVEANKAAGLTGYYIYCTNRTASVDALAADPTLRPSLARYRLHVLLAGHDLAFEVLNGAIVARPQLNVDVQELDPWT